MNNPNHGAWNRYQRLLRAHYHTLAKNYLAYKHRLTLNQREWLSNERRLTREAMRAASDLQAIGVNPAMICSLRFQSELFGVATRPDTNETQKSSCP